MAFIISSVEIKAEKDTKMEKKKKKIEKKKII